MTTLAVLRNKIRRALGIIPHTDDQLNTEINDAIAAIAGGIRMPDREVSPPLPDLNTTDTVITSTSDAYVSLPATYQRDLYYVADSTGERIAPPGDYYDFTLFLNGVYKKDLTETGSIYTVVARGGNIYYQGIPSTATTLTLWFYRTPTALSADSDEPDCLPAHLQKPLIVNYVCREILSEFLHDPEKKTAPGLFDFHDGKFFEAMRNLLDFIGKDAEPKYYATGANYEYYEDY